MRAAGGAGRGGAGENSKGRGRAPWGREEHHRAGKTATGREKPSRGGEERHGAEGKLSLPNALGKVGLDAQVARGQASQFVRFAQCSLECVFAIENITVRQVQCAMAGSDRAQSEAMLAKRRGCHWVSAQRTPWAASSAGALQMCR